MKFFQKTKGAVSIFLIMILLPTMTIAGLFVDVGRVKVSQEVVTTSADLALNTVLSDYDNDLKDYFGLIASAQNTDEVIELSKEYFVSSMVSAGVATSDAQEIAGSIMETFVGESDIRDMLQLSVDGDVTVEKTANGNLNNPALLKQQIVEFMKYRAPVNGVARLFESIQNSDVEEQVEDSSKEAEMTEKKKKFYEAEDELYEQAEAAYKAIKKYNEYKTSSGKLISDEAFLNDVSKFLMAPNGQGTTFDSVYKEAHKIMVMDLYNTHKLEGANLVNLIEVVYISNPGTIRTYSDNNKASAKNIETRLKNFNTALKNYISSKSTLDSNWNSLGELQASDYSIQYWVALTNTCSSSYSDYASKAYTLRLEARKLENAVAYADEGAMETMMKKSLVSNSYVTYPQTDISGELSYQSIYDTLIDKYNNSYDYEVNNGGCSSFRNISSQINSVKDYDALELSRVGHIYNIRNKVYNYQNDFDKAYALAKEAKDKVAKLEQLLEDYKNAFKAWKKAANDSELDSSELAKADRQEIQKLENKGIEHFSSESVTALKKRLENIMTLCKTFRDDLKEIKYNNTPIMKIDSYEAFRRAANLSESKIVRNKNELLSYVDSSYSFTIGKQIQWIEIRDNKTSTTLDDGDAYVITRSFHLNLENYVDDPAKSLYDWLFEVFGKKKKGQTLNESEHGFSVNDDSSAEDAKDKMDNKSETPGDDVNTGENLTGKSFSDYEWAALPSSNKAFTPEEKTLSAKLEDVSEFTADVFGNFSETFGNSLVNARDDLFMTDYVFSMFTYDTFQNEGYFAQLDPQIQNTATASNISSYYTPDIKEKFKDSPDYKTLTLTPKTAEFNYAYGGEVEYILYGNKSNSVNKATAYSQIYMIRYALDLPAVFQEYWDDLTLDAVAKAFQTFAYIPEALTKTLACLAITAAEAGMDLNSLRLGLPVELIKSQEDLVCTYESVFLGNSTGEKNRDTEICLQYSDYLKIFLFIKLVGSGENNIYLRTGDVIQANLSLSTGEHDFQLSKSQVYYDLKATVLVEPMWSKLLAIDDLGDLSTVKDWRTIEVTMRRGY